MTASHPISARQGTGARPVHRWMVGTACLLGIGGSLLAASPARAAAAAPVPARWHEQTTPNPGGSAVLWAVDCVTSANCHAVGSFTGRSGATTPYSEIWNGIRWTAQPAVAIAGSQDASLYSISCFARTACIAVGTALINGAQQAIAERWNGRVWSMLSAVKRSGSALESVSCTSGTRCIAVGVVAAGQGNLPLSELWNGHRWSLVRTPSPRSSVNSAFYGVVCPPDAGGACLAVGQYQDGTYRTRALIERWSGRAWTVSAAQDVPDQGDLLTAIACSSATSCLAVGSATGAAGVTVALSERWNGRTWALTGHQPLDPASVGETSPLAVSCASTGSCVLVGEVAAGAGEQPLAESWDGSRWSTQSMHAPSGGFSYLDGISCASAHACSAVGSNGGGALVEAYGA